MLITEAAMVEAVRHMSVSMNATALDERTDVEIEGVGHLGFREAEEREAPGQFAESGVIEDPLASPPPDLELPVEQRPIGGVDIAVVRALVDEAEYRRDGNRNRLTSVSPCLRPPAMR
jgi:hypothetical protein